MKHCPSCHSRYADETLQFCLQDGTPLIRHDPSGAEPPTVAFGEKTEEFSAEDKTEQFATNRLPATEHFTTNKDAAQMRVEIPPTPAGNWPPSQETQVGSFPNDRPANSSKTLLAVAITALVMLLLFGAIGAGTWFYLANQNEGDLAGETNKKKESNRNAAAADEDSAADPSPTAGEKKTPAPTPGGDGTPEKTPPPAFNPEEVKKEVSGRIYSWKSLAEARDLNPYMASYADTIDYYTKKGASRSFVRSDKLRAFTKYDSIRITLSGMSITIDASGETATAVFDKAWVFQNDTKTSEGKVRSQLKLARIGGDWKITGERDLKVYYTK